MSRLKKRQEAELVLACAPIEDQLQAAKAAHAEQGTDESRAAHRSAMAAMHETRAWLRAGAELQRLPQVIADLQSKLKTARQAKDKQAAERIAGLQTQIKDAEERLARIQAQFGPLVQAMEQLATVGGES